MTPAEFRRWYESRGLSQVELASRLGIPAGQHRVSEWATGKRPVPPYIVAHLRTMERLEECQRASLPPEEP